MRRGVALLLEQCTKTRLAAGICVLTVGGQAFLADNAVRDLVYLAVASVERVIERMSHRLECIKLIPERREIRLRVRVGGLSA